jgi:hypothetical protein
MIVHRDGLPLILCDGCFRPRPTGEPGWQVELGIFPASPARGGDPGSSSETVLQTRQDAHSCPDCATPYGRPLDDA